MKTTNFIDANASGAVKFDDLAEYVVRGCIFPTEICIHYGEAIDSIAVSYGQDSLLQHGTNHGKEVRFKFMPGEHIIKITGETGSYWNNSVILNLNFHTDFGRDAGIENIWDGHKSEGTPFTIHFDKGCALACLTGKLASPIEHGQAVPGYFFLSGLGAYQRETKGTM